MHRRPFLSSVAAAAATVASPISVRSVSESESESESDSRAEWCATEAQSEPESNPTQPLASGEPSFTVTGTKSVDVYWRGQGFFDERGHFFARALGSVGGDTIVLNSDEQGEIDDYALLHELAHTLGYRHGDGGIVNSDVALFSDNGDRDGTELAEPTRDVADSFDGYGIYEEWGIETLGELGVAFAGDDLLVTELGTAGERFAANSDVEDIHIEHSHDGFGGEFDAGPQPGSDNIHAGRFYKSY
jgi:hypothetical protein